MNKLSKVMFVCPYYPPETGGVENYVYNIVDGLIKNYGLDIVIVTTNKQSNSETIEIQQHKKIYRIPASFTLSNTPINPLWYLTLKRIIDEEKPNLINAHAPVPFISDIAALVSGNIPYVLTYHSGTMRKNNIVYDAFIAFYERVIFKFQCSKAKKIICSSNFVQKTMFSNYKEKTIVITPGVNTDVFFPTKTNIRDKNTVLFISSFAMMYRMKGLYVLMEAIDTFTNVTLKVIGEPIKINNDKVLFIGRKYGKDLVEEIQKASVLVLASLAHVESFGMVLIEAMACKTPVVGTRIGGIPEVISEGVDGLVVSPNNPNELSSAIKKILDNKGLAEKMGENGYAKVKSTFKWNYKVKDTFDVFNSI